MTTRNFHESNLQQACVKWFRLQYPNLILFAIPNGGKRNAREAARLKSEGVLAGVSDLFLAYPSRGCHGLFIEMKSSVGKATQNQMVFLNNVERNGYRTQVVKTFEQFVATIKSYCD